MSTHVRREEWPDLTLVSEENWGYRWGTSEESVTYSHLSLGRCDVDPSHGWGTAFMQTSDHRAIVLCEGCYQCVQAEKVGH